MKLKVELDLKTIQALSDLKVEGMMEHLNTYHKCTHRWRTNMEKVGRLMRYITKHNREYSKDQKLMGRFNNIVELIDGLVTPEQTHYIWDTLPPSQLMRIQDIQRMCKWVQGENFDISYYHEYIKKCNDYLEELLLNFNASH